MNRLTCLRNRRGRQRARLVDTYCRVDIACRSGPPAVRSAVPKTTASLRPGFFVSTKRARFASAALFGIGPLGSSISRGAGLARTICPRLSGPMAVGVISARANIRHHTALVTDNSPPMMAAPPPSGILCGVSNSGVCTPGTVSPVCGVRSRCHKQRGSTQHQQTLHDRLLSMRGPRRLAAPYDDVRPHHRASALTGRTFFRSCSTHNAANRLVRRGRNASRSARRYSTMTFLVSSTLA
jgi:hypothetical protein